MLKAAVIGTGKIAAQHLSCLKTLKGVTIAAVCDRSPATAEATADRFGIAAWYTDHRRMLADLKPDLVHVTTPPSSHFALAMDVLDEGCNVLVEKPITVDYADFQRLRKKAEHDGLWLLEDHNYLFNSPVRKVLDLINSGEFGHVVHMELMYCLNMKGGALADPNAPVALPGGGIYHFVSHLAYLACVFIGAHRSVQTIWRRHDPDVAAPFDEFRALIDGESGTGIIGFSGNSQPDGVWLTIHGSRMRARANLFEGRLTVDRMRGVPRPILPMANAWVESRDIKKAAWRSLKGKLRADPGVYEGLWELLRRTYIALASHAPPPISLQQIDNVNRLVAALLPESI